MAYKTPEEMVSFIMQEHLLADACMTIIDGRNEYNFHALEIPRDCVKQYGNNYEIKVFDEDKNEIAARVTVNPSEKEFTFWAMRFDRKNYEIFCLYHDMCNDNPVEIKQKEYLAVIAIFCDRYKISTKTKMMGIFKNGFSVLKKETGINTDCELLRDYLNTDTDVRKTLNMPDKYGVRFNFHFED